MKGGDISQRQMNIVDWFCFALSISAKGVTKNLVINRFSA